MPIREGFHRATGCHAVESKTPQPVDLRAHIGRVFETRCAFELAGEQRLEAWRGAHFGTLGVF